MKSRTKKFSKRARGKARNHRNDFPLERYRFNGNTRNRIGPDQYDTMLLFTYATPLANGSLTGTFITFKPNGAYDVDPALGSVRTLGLSELADMYGRYRVISYSYEIQVVSANTSFPLLVTIVNTPDGLVGISSLQAYAGLQYSQQKMLSVAGGGSDSHTFKGRHSISQIVGSTECELDTDYTASVTSIPVSLTTLAIGIDGMGNLLTSGVFINTRILMHIRMYERTAISTASTSSPEPKVHSAHRPLQLAPLGPTGARLGGPYIDPRPSKQRSSSSGSVQ